LFKTIARLLPLLSLVVFQPGFAAAQQADHPPGLQLGDAVVTGFSGTLPPELGKPLPRGKSAMDLTFINPDGPSVRIVDVGKPGYVWDGRLFKAPKTFDVPAKDVGQVFGVALDDAPQPNIYVAATSVFGLNIVKRGRDGQPERMKKGGPGAGWMKGQFGLDLQGGPGGIYKIDGHTGVTTLFANVTLDGVPNPGPGLGNLAYDAAHKQLFVSDLYTGMIHRFDLDGKELSRYDHGVTGLTAAKLAPIAFDPKNRPNIASPSFESENPNTWGFAPPARRVWGLAVHDGRLYYSVVSGPQIWSIGIEREGGFADDPRWELDVPAQAGSLPVSDIAFSHQGAMLIAQRALIAGAYNYLAFTRHGEPQVLRFWLKDRNDPPSPGRWKLTPEEYAVGFAGQYRNSNGGVALGYGYGRDGAIDPQSCEAALWTTGQNLRNNPALASQLEPGGPLVVHGLQGSPADLVRNANAPPATSYFVDYDDTFNDPRAAGHMGSVRILAQPCAAPVAASAGPTTNVTNVSSPGTPGGPPPNVCVVPPGIPTGQSLPPCTQPGQPVSLDLSTVTHTSTPTADPNWSVSPYGPNGYSTAWGPWTALPLNWVQPKQSAIVQSHPVGTYVYTRTFNLGCSPESYKNLQLCGGYGSDNSSVVTLNAPGNIIASCPNSNCFATPPVNFCHVGPSFFVPGLNVITVTVKNVPGGAFNPTGMSMIAKLEAICGPDCQCGCPPGTLLEGKECVKAGSIIVKKEVTTYNTLIPWPSPGPLFPMTLTCSAPPQSWSFSLNNNGTYTANNIPFGKTCTVAEGAMPAFPPNLCPRGTVPLWTPPPSTTPASVVINGTTVTMIVHNSVTCEEPDDGRLSVTKKVDPDPRGIGTTLSFPMTVTCTNPNASYTLTIPGNTSSVPHNLPVGSHCTVTETQPALPPGCTWLPPTFSPATVPIASGLNQELVTNGYTCHGGPVCPPPQIMNVDGICTCPNGQPPVGGACGPTPPVCPPPQVPNVDGICACPAPMLPGAILGQCICPQGTTLVNGACVPTSPPPPTCQPPLVMIPGVGCGCPRGEELVGKECVKPIVCKPPQVPNAANTGCVCPGNEVLRRGKCVEPEKPKRRIKCPRGTELQDGECVKPKREPRADPGDVIRVLPGFIPGGGGGSPRGGGTPGGGSPKGGAGKP
jgi:hypothetical protein